MQFKFHRAFNYSNYPSILKAKDSAFVELNDLPDEPYDRY